MKVAIFNPLSEDFTVKYNKGGDSIESHTIHSLEIEYFEPHMAEHLKKHLADHIINKRGIKRGNYEATREEVLEEISVDL